MSSKSFFIYIASCFITFAACEDTQIQHANHIFNAIHSSMRQWGSSLNHNGMSFFLATVPAGTRLYHGGSTRDPVIGPEWLAFEAEHALMFARPRRRPPKGWPPHEGDDKEEGDTQDLGNSELRTESRQSRSRLPPPGHPHQAPFHGPEQQQH